MRIGLASGAFTTFVSLILAGAGGVTGASAHEFWAQVTGWVTMACGMLILASQVTWDGRVWWKPSYPEAARKLAEGINDLVTAYRDARPSAYEWVDQQLALRQLDAASARLLERYRTAYQADVLLLLRQLEKRGKSTDELKFIAEHPTNPLGVEHIARELGVLALELRSK